MPIKNFLKPTKGKIIGFLVLFVITCSLFLIWLELPLDYPERKLILDPAKGRNINDYTVEIPKEYINDIEYIKQEFIKQKIPEKYYEDIEYIAQDIFIDPNEIDEYASPFTLGLVKSQRMRLYKANDVTLYSFGILAYPGLISAATQCPYYFYKAGDIFHINKSCNWNEIWTAVIIVVIIEIIYLYILVCLVSFVYCRLRKGKTPSEIIHKQNIRKAGK